MDLRTPTIVNHGIWATHDQCCAVLGANEPAVIDCATEVFHPSWKAQGEGWRLVQARTWLQRMALRWLFDESPYRR
jgi:hypothetical protein